MESKLSIYFMGLNQFCRISSGSRSNLRQWRLIKKSGIVHYANDWAIETMGNPRYSVELFLLMITVSLETQKIVRSLAKLDIL